MTPALGDTAAVRNRGVRSIGSAINDAWQAYWFAPARAVDLAVARVVFFAATFALYLPEDFSRWTTVSQVFWMPIWVFRVLHLPVASHGTLVVLQTIWKIALLGAAVGLFSRASMIVSFVLGFYLLGLPHNFGHTYHFDALLIFVFAILACSRAGDGWALDNIIRTPARTAPDRDAMSGEYRWPVRIVWLAMSLVLVAAGISKLRHSGLEWVFSNTMAIFLTKAHYSFSDANPVVTWGLSIAHHPLLARGMAATALAVETLFPLALVSRRARRLLVPGAFGMLVGIRVLMGPTFGGFLAVFAFWAPWELIGARLAMRARRRAPVVLLYDGECGLCARTVRVVRSLDLLNRVQMRDVVGEWPELKERFPGLSQDACLDEMHVVSEDGRVSRGFAAYRTLARVLPAGWIPLPLLYLPGVGRIGEAAYRFVASHRSRSCKLTPASSR